MWHKRGKVETQTGFWWGNLRKRVYWADLDVDRKKILKLIPKNWNGMV